MCRRNLSIVLPAPPPPTAKHITVDPQLIADGTPLGG